MRQKLRAVAIYILDSLYANRKLFNLTQNFNFVNEVRVVWTYFYMKLKLTSYGMKT